MISTVTMCGRGGPSPVQKRLPTYHIVFSIELTIQELRLIIDLLTSTTPPPPHYSYYIAHKTAVPTHITNVEPNKIWHYVVNYHSWKEQQSPPPCISLSTPPIFPFMTYLVARCKTFRLAENTALCDCKLRKTFKRVEEPPQTPCL